jgi:hypothetical protein
MRRREKVVEKVTDLSALATHTYERPARAHVTDMENVMKDTTHNLKKMIAAAMLSGGLTLAGLALSAGTAQAFNPQPEPPGKPIPPGTSQAFNPVPYPPATAHAFNPAAHS